MPVRDQKWMLAQIEKILEGIDKDELEAANGWWETSTGAEFGLKKLNEIRALLAQESEQR
jgi:hypothetical protein